MFKITTDGVLTTVVDFFFSSTVPYSALIEGSDGDFYDGTTVFGGTYGRGTVYKVTGAGDLITLASFEDYPSETGLAPLAALIQASDGNFYGTCGGGGLANDGTVFKMSPDGGLTALFQFVGGRGKYPLGRLVLAPDSSFYGTTEVGGAFNWGTTFRLTPDGSLTTLTDFTFDGQTNRGGFLTAGLSLSSDGNYYGTTVYGGIADQGTIFRMTANGDLTTLVEFDTSGSNLGCFSGVWGNPSR